MGVFEGDELNQVTYLIDVRRPKTNVLQILITNLEYGK